MPLVIDLSKDKIVIVRIAVAIAISTILGSAPEMDDMFREAVANLKQDELDVREYFDWFVLTTIRDLLTYVGMNTWKKVYAHNFIKLKQTIF